MEQAWRRIDTVPPEQKGKLPESIHAHMVGMLNPQGNANIELFKLELQAPSVICLRILVGFMSIHVSKQSAIVSRESSKTVICVSYTLVVFYVTSKEISQSICGICMKYFSCFSQFTFLHKNYFANSLVFLQSF